MKADELHRLVSVHRFDEARAGPVRVFSNFSDEGYGVERRASIGKRADNHQALSRLNIQRAFDGQLCVLVELLVQIHTQILMPNRIGGAGHADCSDHPQEDMT